MRTPKTHNLTSAGGERRRRRVRVSEPHPLARQAITMRRGGLPSGVCEVAIAKVIGEDVNDIRFVGCLKNENGNEQCDEKMNLHARVCLGPSSASRAWRPLLNRLT